MIIIIIIFIGIQKHYVTFENNSFKVGVGWKGTTQAKNAILRPLLM